MDRPLGFSSLWNHIGPVQTSGLPKGMLNATLDPTVDNHTCTTCTEHTFYQYEVGKDIITYIPIILLIVGTLGNLLIGVVMCRKNFRRTVTGFYLLMLAIADTCVLWTAVFRFVLQGQAHLEIRTISNIACKLHVFLTYWISDFSAWVLVTLAIERWTGVHFPYRVKVLFTKKIAIWSLVLIAIFLGAVNAPLLVFISLSTNTEDNSNGISLNNQCKPTNQTFGKDIWPWVDFCMYTIIPFFIILICNITIVWKLIQASYNRKTMMNGTACRNGNKKHRPSQHSKHGKQVRMSGLTALLIGTSLEFLLLNAPLGIYLILEEYMLAPYGPWTSDDAIANMDLYGIISIILSYSSNATNVFIYCLSGSRFRRELKEMFVAKDFKERVKQSLIFTKTTLKLDDKGKSESTQIIFSTRL